MHFSPDGLAAFRKFLKSEFSEENVEFWLACEDFKRTKSSASITAKAQKIYADFIEADAPKEVKIFFFACTLGTDWGWESSGKFQSKIPGMTENSFQLGCPSIATSAIFQVENYV